MHFSVFHTYFLTALTAFISKSEFHSCFLKFVHVSLYTPYPVGLLFPKDVMSSIEMRFWLLSLIHCSDRDEQLLLFYSATKFEKLIS